MFKINLVPELQERKQQTKKYNYYVVMGVITSLAIVVFIILTLFILSTYNRLAINTTNKKIEETQTEVAKYKDLEETVVSLQNGLTGIKSIMNGGNKWTELFPILESATPSDVQFDNLKLTPSTLSAELTGKNVTSLARFMDSYKSLTIMSISGNSSSPTITVTKDNSVTKNVTVRNNGTWKVAFYINPAIDQTFTIADGEQQSTVKWSAQTKTIENSGSTNAQVMKLFTNVDTKEYQKDGGKVKFTVTADFNGGLLW